MKLILTINIIILSVLIAGIYLFYNVNVTKKDIIFPDKYVIKDFPGYDYPNDKKSGVGGGLVVGNPLPIDVPSEIVDGIF